MRLSKYLWTQIFQVPRSFLISSTILRFFIHHSLNPEIGHMLLIIVIIRRKSGQKNDKNISRFNTKECYIKKQRLFKASSNVSSYLIQNHKFFSFNEIGINVKDFSITIDYVIISVEYHYLSMNQTTVANIITTRDKHQDIHYNPLKICQTFKTKMDNSFMNSSLHAK